jgi:hypothetical protein
MSHKTDWRIVVERWRALPAEEKLRRHLEAIPRHVARSMAMEGECEDVEALERRLRVRLAKGCQTPVMQHRRGK